MSLSARLSLPFIMPGQAQKEFFHNEALQLLDFIVQPVVEALPADSPPASAEPGQSYLVGVSPTGAWIGHPGALACMTEGGWRFCEPFEGMEVKLRPSGERATYVMGSWQVGILEAREVRVEGKKVLSTQAPSIGDATEGVTTDVQARATLLAVLGALRHHGLIAQG